MLFSNCRPTLTFGNFIVILSLMPFVLFVQVLWPERLATEVCGVPVKADVARRNGHIASEPWVTIPTISWRQPSGYWRTPSWKECGPTMWVISLTLLVSVSTDTTQGSLWMQQAADKLWNSEPVELGWRITMCFLSKAPRQCGICHRDSNRSAIFSHSSGVPGYCKKKL